MIIQEGERIRCSGSILGKSFWSKRVCMPWDCGIPLSFRVRKPAEEVRRWSVVEISCLTALCCWNLAVCTLMRILLTIQRQESWLKEGKTTYPRPSLVKFTSRFRRFRDSVGAFNSLRDVTTPPTLCIRFVISRLRCWSQFTSRLRGVGALNWLHDVVTRPIELRGLLFQDSIGPHYSLRDFAISRLHRRSQFASRFRNCVGTLNLLCDFVTP
jgi:hypothetical protein